MCIKQLSTVIALCLMCKICNTAFAQAGYIEGTYLMTYDGAINPATGVVMNAGGTAVVELHAINDSIFQMTGFLHPDVTVDAKILQTGGLNLPYQVVSEDLLALDERSWYQFNAIGGAVYDWNHFAFVGSTGTLIGNVRSTNNTIVLAFYGNLAAIKAEDMSAVQVYRNVMLFYDSPLPLDGVAQVGSAVVAAERWYTIDGREVACPAGRDGQIYIVVRQMQDGKVNSVKVRN